MNYSFYFWTLLLSGLLSACGGGVSHQEQMHAHKPERMDWLPGQWSNPMPEGESGESWTQLNDSTYTGIGYFVKGKDTLFSEKLWLGYIDGVLCYQPTIANQNNGQPVTFKLKSRSDTSLVFENPAHDFPQQIAYVLHGKDSLVAQISGSKAGKQQVETFPMKRK